MTKAQIQQHNLFQKLTNIPLIELYEVIFKTYKTDLENIFEVSITEAPFTLISDLKDSEIGILCLKDKNTAITAVFTPKNMI